jgi:mannosyl-3-phosphoglycerate phosphatase
MKIVLTDLDGTLLDYETYEWHAARPALARLAAESVPVILCTSKTRAEVIALRLEMGIRHPFIVENGGAIVVPAGTFPFSLDAPSSTPRTDARDEIVGIGTPRAQLVRALTDASRESGVAVCGFADLEPWALSSATGLSLADARLALAREWDEPFLIADSSGAEDVERLRRAIEARGFRCTEGGRFHHITGASDKGVAAHRLLGWYRRLSPALRVLALGDAPNDLPLLSAAADAVIVNGPRAADLAALLPSARVRQREGPAGWNEAVLAWLD